MISGLLCFKQNPNANLLALGEVPHLTFCCGTAAQAFVRFLRNPDAANAEGDLFDGDVSLRALPPEVVTPILSLEGFEETLDAALLAAKTFVLADLSYLRRKDAEKAWRRLAEKYASARILVYVPQCKQSALPLSFASASPDALEGLEAPKDYLMDAFDAFVLDLARGIAPREGVLLPSLSQEEEPPASAVEKIDAEPVSEAGESKEENPSEGEVPSASPEKKKTFGEAFKAFFRACRDFFSLNADYFFGILFAVLAMALNLIVHFMPREEQTSNFPLLCLALSFVFSLCSAAPNVFIVKDTRSPFSFRARVSYVLQGITCALCFAASLTLAAVADYGPIASAFPAAFALSPLLTALGVLFLERKKVAAYFRNKKEKNHVS